MSSIVVSGDTSGAITLQAPAVSGTNTLTLPASTDTLVGKATTDTLTNKTLTSPIIAGTPSGVGTLTAGTAVASTSGTSIDFTGIPSWAKRVTVMFSGVSTNGTSVPIIQLGTSGGIQATGYLGGAEYASVAANFTTGFGLFRNWVGTFISHGSITITNISSNSFVATGVIALSNANATADTAGSVTLSSTLDRLRITTVNGTDAFDAGSINILYE